MTQNASLNATSEDIIQYPAVTLIFYSAGGIFGVLGNLIVVIVFGKETKKTKKGSNLLITLIGVVDTCVCSTMFVAFWLFFCRTTLPVILGYAVLTRTGVYCMLFLCQMVAVDRYLAVYRPHSRLMTCTRIVRLSAFALLLSLTLAVCSLVNPAKDVFNKVRIGMWLYWMTLSLMVVIYVLVCKRLFSRRVGASSVTAHSSRKSQTSAPPQSGYCHRPNNHPAQMGLISKEANCPADVDLHQVESGVTPHTSRTQKRAVVLPHTDWGQMEVPTASSFNSGEIQASSSPHADIETNTQPHANIAASTRPHANIETSNRPLADINASTLPHGRIEASTHPHANMAASTSPSAIREASTPPYDDIEASTPLHGNNDGNTKSHKGISSNINQIELEKFSQTPKIHVENKVFSPPHTDRVQIKVANLPHQHCDQVEADTLSIAGQKKKQVITQSQRKWVTLAVVALSNTHRQAQTETTTPSCNREGQPAAPRTLNGCRLNTTIIHSRDNTFRPNYFNVERKRKLMRRTVVMFSLITFLFMFSWVPTWLYSYGIVKHRYNEFIFINNLVNPIIYYFFNRKFSAEIKKHLKCCQNMCST